MKDEEERPNRGRDRETVIESIERVTGTVARVSLPGSGADPEGARADDASAKLEFSARVRGDYRVLGPVARGGMGTVFRGQDMDLGREVALKVLDERLARNPEIVRRFVEEAQIGGQLQHPGVVPVYELGLMADERPFFTMKLIKGRTLASMLAERESPADELRRFLSIFEQVCQTLAYAHEKRVIHRDLKPANIMVGAFGEVQVVDWGLAKVLVPKDEAAASGPAPDGTTIETVRSASRALGDSVVGSVMGTLAYMPPEQARGDVDELDARADVFALGAILCEILTGRPPYLEDAGGGDLLEQAARGRLGPARARIETCGADEDLRRVCLDCLAAAPAARPSDAAALSRAMHDHFSATDERARRAQLDAAEARVKVAEGRKRQRLTVALAGTLVTLLVAVGGGYLWMEHERDQRLAESRQRIDSLQANALEMQTAGRHGEAAAFAREALAVAEADALGGDVVERLDALVERAERLAVEQRERAVLERRNEELFRRLGEIHLVRNEAVNVSDADIDRAYAEAFRDYGIDLESDDIVETLEELRARGMGAELAIAIDDWSRTRRQLYGWGSFEAQALTALAADLDPDEDRMRVRSALLEVDKDALLRMANEIDVTSLPAETIWVLVTAVDDLEGDPLGLLQRSVAAYPSDFRFRLRLAEAYWDRRLLGEAVEQAEVGHALAPDHVYLTGQLAFQRRDTGSYPRAERLYRGLVERLPPDAGMRQHLAFCQLGLGRYAEAAVEFDRAWDEAVISPSRTAERAAAHFLAGDGDSDELRASLARSAVADEYALLMEAWALAVAAEPARRDPERALAVAAEYDRRFGRHVFSVFCRAVALHRLEDPSGVLDALAELGALYDVRPEGAFASAAIAAVAYERLDDRERAKERLALAEHLFRRLAGPDADAWRASPYFRLLVEARALVD